MQNHDRHHPRRWLGAALAVLLAPLTMHAFAQPQNHDLTANARAVFQGRPAMAGAQAGLGAMAGPPQGGIGLQGSDGAGLNLRRPYVVAQQEAPLPPVACSNLPRTSATPDPLCLPEISDERFERRLALLGIDAQQRGRM